MNTDHKRGLNEDSPNVSPAEIQKYLKGLGYPAYKDEVIECAQDNDAPNEILGMLEKLPADEFGGPQDIMKVFGDEKSREE